MEVRLLALLLLHEGVGEVVPGEPDAAQVVGPVQHAQIVRVPHRQRLAPLLRFLVGHHSLLLSADLLPAATQWAAGFAADVAQNSGNQGNSGGNLVQFQELVWWKFGLGLDVEFSSLPK